MYQYLKESGCSEFLNIEEEADDDNNEDEILLGNTKDSDVEIAHKNELWYQRVKCFINKIFHPPGELLSLVGMFWLFLIIILSNEFMCSLCTLYALYNKVMFLT